MDTKIDQKKYLQKYLNPKKHKKKGQKKKENTTKRVNIIDDDIDVSQMMPIGDSEIDIYTTGEDAPQIAGIIDERPIDVQLKEKFKFNTQWKLINDDDGFNSKLIIKEQKRKIKNSSVGDESNKISDVDDSQDYSPKRRKNYSDDENESTRTSRLDSSKVKKIEKNSDSDFSPPRSKRAKECDSSPVRKEFKHHSDSDSSPPRKKQTNNENLRKTKSSNQSDSDTSPPRKHIKSEKGMKHNSDSDASPPRRNSSKYDSDTSPPRKKSLKSEKRTSQDFESSGNPPKKRNKNSSRWNVPDLDADPSRKHKNNRSDSDTSPPRKSSIQSDHNFEKSKRNYVEPNSFRDKKIEKKRFRPDLDSSPPRIRKGEANERPGSPKNVNVVRFNIRNPDQAEKKLDAEKRKLQEEKYATWGKGLKQVEERREKMDNDSHEMSKPLARYANDEDLESFLKDQEREGDPMLEYIRKQNKAEKQDDKPSKPKYEGAFMPNRFGISPGYRWDGVDRSNGYEANWFNVQNSKKVLQDEAYKWSTDDM